MKSKQTAAILALLLGGIGAHQFYLGKTGKGILYLFTFGLIGIGALIDCIKLFTMSDADFNIKYNKN